MTPDGSPILTIGATGMLSGVTHALADRGHPVWVLSRHADAFVAQLGRARRLTPLQADYKADPEDLLARLPPATAIIAWLHGERTPLLSRIAERCGAQRVVHVVSSASADPNTESTPPDEPTCRWQRVILGFVIEPTGSRWLTHDEICAGVLTAIDSGAPESTVGTTRPWSARP